MLPTIARTGLSSSLRVAAPRASARASTSFVLQSKRGYASDKDGHQDGKSKLVSRVNGRRGDGIHSGLGERGIWISTLR